MEQLLVLLEIDLHKDHLRDGRKALEKGTTFLSQISAWKESPVPGKVKQHLKEAQSI